MAPVTQALGVLGDTLTRSYLELHESGHSLLPSLWADSRDDFR